jgi:hypothetical protein
LETGIAGFAGIVETSGLFTRLDMVVADLRQRSRRIASAENCI